MRAHEIELLALRAQREQWTTIAVLPVRLRAYAELARLLASEQDGSAPPPPPAEPRPGPSELWERLDGAYRVAAAAVTTTAGLAYDRLAAAAGELAERIERECEQVGQTVGEHSRVLPAGSGEPAR